MCAFYDVGKQRQASQVFAVEVLGDGVGSGCIDSGVQQWAAEAFAPQGVAIYFPGVYSAHSIVLWWW